MLCTSNFIIHDITLFRNLVIQPIKVKIQILPLTRAPARDFIQGRSRTGPGGGHGLGGGGSGVVGRDEVFIFINHFLTSSIAFSTELTISLLSK